MTIPHHKSDYMPSLDGIRGLACLLVIVSHIGSIFHLSYQGATYNIGSFGVIVFFSLSGFLMSSLYCKDEFNFKNAGKYAIARAARIAPAYYIAVIVAWVLYMLIPDFEYQMTPFMMLRSLAFGGNQGVFWSIPPEIQFYGFFLLLWFAYYSFKKGNKLWLILSALLCVIFIATRDIWGGLMLPSKLHIFIFGFLAAFLLRKDAIKSMMATVPFQISTVAATMLYAYFLIEPKEIYDHVVFAGLVSLSIASLSQSTPLTKIFETQTMRLMGAVSFSVYLFHDMILHVIADLGLVAQSPTMLLIAITSVVSLALPVAFHFLAEKPMNKTARDKMMLYFNNHIVPFVSKRRAKVS